MPDFDLFSFAKGAEYAGDQNTADALNARRIRREDDSIGMLERQLQACKLRLLMPNSALKKLNSGSCASRWREMPSFAAGATVVSAA